VEDKKKVVIMLKAEKSSCHSASVSAGLEKQLVERKNKSEVKNVKF
jgi:hypothetical protein